MNWKKLYISNCRTLYKSIEFSSILESLDKQYCNHQHQVHQENYNSWFVILSDVRSFQNICNYKTFLSYNPWESAVGPYDTYLLPYVYPIEILFNRMPSLCIKCMKWDEIYEIPIYLHINLKCINHIGDFTSCTSRRINRSLRSTNKPSPWRFYSSEYNAMHQRNLQHRQIIWFTDLQAMQKSLPSSTQELFTSRLSVARWINITRVWKLWCRCSLKLSRISRSYNLVLRAN